MHGDSDTAHAWTQLHTSRAHVEVKHINSSTAAETMQRSCIERVARLMHGDRDAGCQPEEDSMGPGDGVSGQPERHAPPL